MAEKVKVRIALAIDDEGTWNACGWSTATDEEATGVMWDGMPPEATVQQSYWITAEIEVPEVYRGEIAGKVEFPDA